MAPNENSSKVLVEPTRTNGSVSRLVEMPDGSSRVETWRDGAWMPGGADVSAVMRGAPASAELLAELGVTD